MIQASEQCILRRSQKYDCHPRRSKGQVENHDGRQQEEEQGEKYGAQQELVEVVVT